MSATPLSYRPAPTAPGAVAVARNQPSIRVCPVPRAEPPTDDEVQEAGWDPPASGTPALPLDLPRRHLRGGGLTPGFAGPAAGVGARAGIAARPALGAAAPDGAQPQQRPGEPSPARAATRLFLATCLEIVGGYRPVTHLRPFCRPERFPDIANEVTGRVPNPAGRFRGRAYGVMRAPSPPPPGPPRPAGIARCAPPERVSLRRVQASEAVAGAIEVAVVLTRSDQVWAMAFRLEEWRGRWLCSCLEVL